MVDASPQLIWQLIKKNNAFLQKNVNNTWFSSEPANLTGRHSYKYSGIANTKAVSIRPDFDGEEPVIRVTKKNKKGGVSSWELKGRKGSRKVAQAIGRDVGGYRPDLKLKAMQVGACAFAGTRREVPEEDEDIVGGGGGRRGGGAAAPGGAGADDDDSDDDMPGLA